MNDEKKPAVAGQVERRVMHHTPGPWEVMSGDNYEVRSPLLPREYPHQCKEDSTGDFVAYIGNHAQDFGWANACLIAAAPELLAALEFLLEQAEGFNVSGVYFNEFRENRDALDTAADAIAKALGREA